MSLSYNKKNITLARNLRKRATPQEKHLWYDFLSKYEVRFQRQKAIDNINRQYGKPAVKIGTQILATNAKPLTKKEKLSPCYTTNIREIMNVKC